MENYINHQLLFGLILDQCIPSNEGILFERMLLHLSNIVSNKNVFGDSGKEKLFIGRNFWHDEAQEGATDWV